MQHRTVSPSLSVSAHSQPRPQPKTKDITKIQAAEKRIKVTCKWEITDSRSQVQILTCPHLPSDESEKQAQRPPTAAPRNVFVVRGGTTQQQLVGKRETNRRGRTRRRRGAGSTRDPDREHFHGIHRHHISNVHHTPLCLGCVAAQRVTPELLDLEFLRQQ